MNASTLWSGKTAVVTGGGIGIGKAYSKGFAARGAATVIADIDHDAAKETATEIQREGGDAIAIPTDVGEEDSVSSLFRTVTEHYGKLNFLVNNAAIMLQLEKPFKPFWETSIEEWDRIFRVNTASVFLCCKHAKPLMEIHGGRIVNISSDAIWKGYESQLGYFASKGAVHVMSRNLARELGPFNINVNTVAPGYTLSQAVLESDFMMSVQDKVMASNCIKRDQYPEDVVGAVMFLCSDESSCITGQSIVVNCGAIMP